VTMRAVGSRGRPAGSALERATDPLLPETRVARDIGGLAVMPAFGWRPKASAAFHQLPRRWGERRGGFARGRASTPIRTWSARAIAPPPGSPGAATDTDRPTVAACARRAFRGTRWVARRNVLSAASSSTTTPSGPARPFRLARVPRPGMANTNVRLGTQPGDRNGKGPRCARNVSLDRSVDRFPLVRYVTVHNRLSSCPGASGVTCFVRQSTRRSSPPPDPLPGLKAALRGLTHEGLIIIYDQIQTDDEGVVSQPGYTLSKPSSGPNDRDHLSVSSRVAASDGAGPSWCGRWALLRGRGSAERAVVAAFVGHARCVAGRSRCRRRVLGQ